MLRLVALTALGGVLLLGTVAMSGAKEAQATFGVGAIVAPLGCSMATRPTGAGGLDVRCGGTTAFHSVLSGPGGVAGPDGTDGQRMTVAY